MSCSAALASARAFKFSHPHLMNQPGLADNRITVAYWQARMTCRGYYSGPVDGIWGPNSRAAVQQDMAARYSYTGPIDGVWGVNTWAAIQRFAAAEGGYSGPIDGVPGPNTWTGIFGAVVDML